MTMLTKSALAAMLAMALVSAAEAQQVTRQIEILPAPAQVAANAAPQAAAPATDGANIPATPQEAAPVQAAPAAPTIPAPVAPAPKAEPKGEQNFVAPKFAEPKPFHGEYRHAYGYGSGHGYARRGPHCH